MKILSAENGQLEISQIYNPVKIISTGGQVIYVACRDDGLEIIINVPDGPNRLLSINGGEKVDLNANQPLFRNGQAIRKKNNP